MDLRHALGRARLRQDQSTEAHGLRGFVQAFGDDAHGRAERQDQGETGRFRKFTREEIAARNDNLDITWLRDDSAAAEDGLQEPEDIAAAILGHLKAALTEIEAVSEELETESEVDSAL